MPDTNNRQLLLEPADLAKRLGERNLVIVDLCKLDTYRQAHIPGAVHIQYSQVVRHAPPVMGLLPEPQAFSKTLGDAGITPESLVVAYDDEGGGKAGRFLWTLEVAGHRSLVLLNGGLHAWVDAGLPLDNARPHIAPVQYPVNFTRTEIVADADYILSNLENSQVTILDTRSIGEFRGTDTRAARGGHIPGAVNFDWVEGMDRNRGLRMKSREELLPALAALGITPDKEIIVHCQSHHRSAHTFYLLKVLGFEKVRGYPGAWSDWGNRNDTPIEQ